MRAHARVKGVASRDDGTYNAAEECTNMSATISINEKRWGKQEDVSGWLVQDSMYIFAMKQAQSHLDIVASLFLS